MGIAMLYTARARPGEQELWFKNRGGDIAACVSCGEANNSQAAMFEYPTQGESQEHEREIVMRTCGSH